MDGVPKLDARGRRTEYAYDGQQRVTAIRYYRNSDNQEYVEDAKYFYYDVQGTFDR